MKRQTFQIVFVQNRSREWFWRMFAENGKQVCRSSETYQRRRDMENSWNQVADAFTDGRYEVTEKVQPKAK